MSYDITLAYPDGPAQVPSHQEGGTYVMGGTTDAHLNITYNYYSYYRKHIDPDKGIRWLYGQTGGATAPRLAAAIAAILVDEALEAEQLAQVAERRARAATIAPPPPPEPDESPIWGLARAMHESALTGPTGYWEPTRANAARALGILLGWALQHPDATFEGD